jgi:5-methylcytosine-specific restriction endonuclease McrA
MRAAEATLPFGRLPRSGRELLGRPKQGDLTARHGYGRQTFELLGHRCVYCGQTLSDYRDWLNISIDHVIPRQLIGRGWPVVWIEDLANLVPCCRACNEFTNSYTVLESPPPNIDEFLDLRDRHYLAKLALTRVAHDRERAWHTSHVTASTPSTDLLSRYVEVVRALQAKGLIRGEKVVGGYAEALVIRALELRLATGEQRGYDANDPKTGLRYQIKSRRISQTNRDAGVGPFRDLDVGLFDVLVAVIFDQAFDIVRAARVPVAVVREMARTVNYDGTKRLQIGPRLLAHPDVEDVTELTRDAAAAWG